MYIQIYFRSKAYIFIGLLTYTDASIIMHLYDIICNMRVHVNVIWKLINRGYTLLKRPSKGEFIINYFMYSILKGCIYGMMHVYF